MKNVKLTLVTTLSVLALAFSGAASANRADNDNQKSYQKNKITKSSKAANQKYLNRNGMRNVHRAQPNKRVVVKQSPKRKVVISRTVVKKPAKLRYVSNKRFNKTKQYNQRVNANKRYSNNKRFNRANRLNSKRMIKQYVYSVRPGDTLIQVSFKTGVSIHQLARLNRIKHRNLNHLRVGQILRLI